MRGEADLRVLNRDVEAHGRATRSPVGASDRIGELALALLDGRDALGQLTTEPAELLFGRDPDGAQPFLLVVDGDRLALLAEERHASMICAGRPFSCFSPYAARSSRSSARARPTISSRSPQRSLAFSLRSDCQRVSSRASSALIWSCTDVSRPSERRCQRSWRSSESCSICVWI